MSEKNLDWYKSALATSAESHSRIVQTYLETRDEADAWRELAGFHIDAHWSAEDAAWVATCAERPSLSFIGTNRPNALAGLSRLLLDIERGNA